MRNVCFIKNLGLSVALTSLVVGASTAFASDDEVYARLSGVFSTANVTMTHGCGFSLDLPVSLGSDGFYMRGQTPGLVPLRNLLDAPAPQPGPFDAPNLDATNVDEKQYALWATPFYSNLRADEADASKNWAIGASEYRMERVGGMVGATKDVTARTTIGWLFGYSSVKMTQDFPVVDETQTCVEWDENGAPIFYEAPHIERHLCEVDIDSDDIQFGVNFSHLFVDDWRLAGNFQGGSQRFRWNRQMQARVHNRYEGTYADRVELYEGDISGNTFSANLFLSKKFDLNSKWAFTPGVGVESAHSWMYRAQESGRNVTHYDVPDDERIVSEYGAFWHTYKLTDKIRNNRVTARVGGQLDYNGGEYGFNLKGFYGTQLGGKDCPEVSIALTDATTVYRANGLGFGRDTLKLGGGAWLALNETGTATLGGNYEAMFYKRATTQSANGTFTARF